MLDLDLTQEIAALGTLHDGEPFVSMVPYALHPGGCAASMAASMCGTMPSVQPKAATTLARAPRDRPVAIV